MRTALALRSYAASILHHDACWDLLVGRDRAKDALQREWADFSQRIWL